MNSDPQTSRIARISHRNEAPCNLICLEPFPKLRKKNCAEKERRRLPLHARKEAMKIMSILKEKSTGFSARHEIDCAAIEKSGISSFQHMTEKEAGEPQHGVRSVSPMQGQLRESLLRRSSRGSKLQRSPTFRIPRSSVSEVSYPH